METGVLQYQWALPTSPRLRGANKKLALTENTLHELNHHYCDQKLLKNGEIRCGDYNANELIEKAAEVFAAEFIYPSQEFLDCAESLGLRKDEVTSEEIVELKLACGAPVSYKFLQTRLEWFGFIEQGEVRQSSVSEARRRDLRGSNLSSSIGLRREGLI